ncbi:MAG: aromatic ring-hydroxylating dioxygenase subunit alpha [Myxococcales bacterium]|nr:aromatic ring-hydroxylating dioxygenase subunit alpha [Myxococcales bacterium]
MSTSASAPCQDETEYAPGWYAIAEPREIPADRPVKLRRFGVDLVLFRDKDGSIACLDDRCKHRGASLALGNVKDGCVACPFHGFEFDAKGECKHLPVLGAGAKIPKAMNTRAYTVREQDDWLWLYWGEFSGELPEIPRFEHLYTSKRRAHTIVREWSASFVRVIENQLDPFHLPFVHKSTIGRNMPPAMTVNYVEEGSRITAWPGEARTDKHAGFFIEFCWANLWVNHISDQLDIVAVFAPIDATHTRTYLRTFQGFVTIPVLGWIVDRVMALSNVKIFAQDEGVVVSQPQSPLLATDEVLVKADGAIIAFRKMYARALRSREPVESDRAAE